MATLSADDKTQLEGYNGLAQGASATPEQSAAKDKYDAALTAELKKFGEAAIAAKSSGFAVAATGAILAAAALF